MLKGTLDDFSLPEIFRLTSHVKKTGRLEVERRNGSGRVYFRDGDVYYAESTKSKEPLGRKLMRSGRVNEEQLRSAIDENEATGKRVGEILVERGVVELEQIEWAVRSQIEDAVFDLLRWDLGAFVWEPDVETEVEVPLAVSVDNLIIEASRRLDEISQIRRQIESPDVVLAMAPRPPDGAHQINITSEEWQVLVLVDGHRSVADIASFIGADAFQTTRMLFGLMNAGLIYNTRDKPAESSYEHQQRNQPFLSKHADRWFDSEDDESNVVELQPERSVESASVPPAPPDFESEVDEGSDRREPPLPEPSVPEGVEEDDDEEPAPPSPPSEVDPTPRVDRAAVVRELAGLFSDEEKPKPRAVPSGSGDQNAPPAPPQRRRIEDDEDVDRGIITRMIDGVKEL
ncbi:MAG: DUF4388 domain-containing protein [Actinomycetota bacterium]